MKFTAPAKIILVGEHAVVYGKPAIAVPISGLQAEAIVSANTGNKTGLHIHAVDLNEVLPIDIESGLVDNALAVTARLVLQRLHATPPDVTISVKSTIPMASGLGSGAAVSAALAQAVANATGSPLTTDNLNSIVYEIEKIYHGTPSGIDNTVIVYQKPVYYIRGKSIETLSIAEPFTIVIADTGQSALTKVAVGDVRKLMENNPDEIHSVLNEIEQVVQKSRLAIEEGDIAQLGSLMYQNHLLLQQLTVSSPELDHLVEAAMNEEAIGAKLSGGGRGGNMIALVTDDRSDIVQKALLKAGAVRVFSSVIQKHQD